MLKHDHASPSIPFGHLNNYVSRNIQVSQQYPARSAIAFVDQFRRKSYSVADGDMMGDST